jgi:hypothetical protein
LHLKEKSWVIAMRRFCCLLLILCLCVGIIGIAQATTQSINVEAGKERICKIDVAPNDRVQFTFSTIGQASNHLSFSIVFPNSTATSIGEVDKYSSSFTSNVKGICELHFDNTNSNELVFVALNYEVEHYIFGMPQMVFVLVAIVVLLLIIVAGYFILGKYS